MTEKTISASKIDTYIRCPLTFRFRYIDKIPIPESYEFVYGKTVHGVISKLNKAELEIGGLKEAITKTWESQSKKMEHVKDFDLTKTVVELCNLVLGWYNQSNRTPVTESEVRIIRPLQDPIKKVDVGWLIEGVVDGITSPNTVVEYKTAGRTWAEERFMVELQSDIYTLLLQNYKETGITDINFVYEIMVKTKKPSYSVTTLKKTQKDAYRAFKVCLGVVESIEKELFYPRRTFLCSSGFCEYFETCMSDGWLIF